MKWQIGDVTVTKIVELETTGGSRFILPQATREAILPISWLIPHFADEEGRLKMSIHALIVEAPGRRIIVDTCLGNDKKDRRIPTWNDRQGRFLEDLAAAGIPATRSIPCFAPTSLLTASDRSSSAVSLILLSGTIRSAPRSGSCRARATRPATPAC